MKTRKIIATLLATTMIIAVSACSSDSDSDETTVATESIVETEAPTEATETTEEVTEPSIEETTKETNPFVEPEVPFDDANYAEFGEPIYFDVIEDAPAYYDVGLNNVAMTYVAGSMVMGVASDGRYIVLDSGFVVDGQYLRAYE